MHLRVPHTNKIDKEEELEQQQEEQDEDNDRKIGLWCAHGKEIFWESIEKLELELNSKK